MKFTIPVIDSHYHIHAWGNSDGQAFWDSTKAYYDSRNFQTININALPSVKRDVSNNIITALYKLRHPEVFAHGGLIYESYPVPETLPEGIDPLTQYRELMDIGFDGIKMLEAKPAELKVIGRPVCDPLYEPFFAAVERDETHMVWHVADPDSFWDPERAPAWTKERGWNYSDGTYPSFEEIFSQVSKVLEKHPALKVTFAHFFFLSVDPQRLEREFLDRYPGVNVDLTPGTEMYGSFGKNPAYFRDYFTRHADRIEYGTDASDHSNLEYNLRRVDTVYEFLTTTKEFDVWGYQFRGLGLNPVLAEKILSGNFLRRVSEKPKPICVEALKGYYAKYRHWIREDAVRAKIDAEMEKL